MKLTAFLVAFVCVVFCIACHKTDPENHPEYIGRWVHPDFDAGGVECDFVLQIPADGEGSRGMYGDYCSGVESGDCKIKRNKIKIGDKSFEIIEEPHAVASLLVPTISMDTVVATTVMKLRWKDFIVPYEREFYKID